ncbi:MAG: acetyl-CoA C-acyltransferase [Betaproteobacteria bacterium]|nr:MAG: acetyl-CoA C-acyltransferase [Betaproteobacteria bacterium]
MNGNDIWLAAGLRTPFARVDGPLAGLGAIGLSVPVMRAMIGLEPSSAAPRPRPGEGSIREGIRPDLLVWGTVIPNLGYSNIAREVQIEAGLDRTVPAFSTVLACSTSMVAALEAASMLGHGGMALALVGGVESMSRVQIGLSQNFSDWLRRFSQARSIAQRLASFKGLRARDIRLHILAVENRATGKSMGEHCEEMAKAWSIARDPQDRLALASHEKAVAGQKAGFFDDLIVPVAGTSRDGFPRADTSLERLAKLQPAFDRTSGKGTLTAGNSSPLTDGAAGLWVATGAGLKRLPGSLPRVRLVDWEIAAVDLFTEGLLMAPAYAIPRMLARNGLRYGDIALWEIHEAFAAQVLCNVAALESRDFRRRNAGVDADLGEFPWERLNPHGGSVALGHPFGATGARILSQALKELAAMPKGSRAVVSICADGGLGTVALLQAE